MESRRPAEFGSQLLIFVDESGVEAHQLLFRIPETAAEGTVIGTFSAINAASNTSASTTLVGMSDDFELIGANLQVKAGAVLSYQTERRYRLVFLLQEGELMTRRFVVIEIINPGDGDDDGLIDITTLDRLNVMRYDLDGDGEVTVVAGSDVADLSAASVADLEAALGHASIYAAQFTGGAYYDASDMPLASNGAIVLGSRYTYKLPISASGSYMGYELVESLDFNDVDAMTDGNQLSRWAEGASAAGVAGAVSEGWMPIGDASSPYATVL